MWKWIGDQENIARMSFKQYFQGVTRRQDRSKITWYHLERVEAKDGGKKWNEKKEIGK